MAARLSFTPLLVSLVLGAGSCALPLEGWRGEKNYVNFSQSEEVAGDETLTTKIELKVGEMEIEPAENPVLYAVDMRYNELAFKPDVSFSREGGAARLAVALEGKASTFGGIGENLMNLRLNRNLPLQLETRAGVGEAHIDLTDMNIESLSMQSGVGEMEISILEPNKGVCRRVEINSGVGSFELRGLGNLGFEEFSFRGGVGGSVLDFSGSWERIGDVVVEVGVGGVEIKLPRDVGAEIRISKGFFSDYDLPDFEKRGDTYYSENMDQASKVIKLRITAGIGGVEVDWI